MSDIEKQIEKNTLLLKKIESIAKKISITSDNKREMLFAGFFKNSLVHYHSINILCEKKLYNSAFALIRVLFEGIIRAEYLYCGFTDEQIHNIYNGGNWGKAFPSIGDMCKKIDTQYDVKFYSDIKDMTYKGMNDYTHTGFRQISSNFNAENGTIKTNFKESEIINILQSNNGIVKLLSVGYFEKIGLKYGTIQKKDVEDFLKYPN
jgi:hypothetical protein